MNCELRIANRKSFTGFLNNLAEFNNSNHEVAFRRGRLSHFCLID